MSGEFGEVDEFLTDKGKTMATEVLSTYNFSDYSIEAKQSFLHAIKLALTTINLSASSNGAIMALSCIGAMAEVKLQEQLVENLLVENL
jgi:hypothetical protein